MRQPEYYNRLDEGDKEEEIVSPFVAPRYPVLGGIRQDYIPQCTNLKKEDVQVG